MFESIIDNISDEEISKTIKESYCLVDLMKKLGYKSTGQNSRGKVRSRIAYLAKKDPSVKFRDPEEDEKATSKISKANINTQGRIGVTKVKGDISEQAVALEFLYKGIPTLKPIGDNCPYDLVVEINGKFYKIQVKTGKLYENGKSFYCKFVRGTLGVNKERVYREYTKEEVDIFAVYCIDTRETCFIKFDDPKKRTVMHFRRVPWKGKYEEKRFSFVKDYTLDKLLENLNN